MSHNYDFSLIIGHQYEGSPLQWSDQSLFVTSGSILTKVDITKDACKAYKLAKSGTVPTTSVPVP